MKKLTVLLVLLFTLVFLNYRVDAAIKVRPYGTVGGTVVDLPWADDWDTLKSGGGVQGLYETFPGISFGIDMAFIHAYWVESLYGYDVEYFNLLGIAEYQHWVFIFQTGLGPYFGVGANDDASFGVMFGGGVDIPINKMLSVALLVRMDLIFENWYKGDDVTFMPGFMGGLTLKF